MKLTLFILCIYGSQFISGHSIPGQILYPPQQPPSNYVVGGRDAKDGEAPYQCSLQYRNQHFCGCSIFSSEWIITAAHCAGVFDASEIEVYVGSNELSGDGTYYSINNSILHEGFGNQNLAYDIAVLRVNGSIEFNDNVQSIELSTDEVPDGAVAQLTGWGLLSTDGSVPNNLQVIELNVVQTERCQELFGFNVHESHICTFNKRGEGACYGDSGGPLVFDNQLIGIVNFGRPCAKGYPDAYAKISYLYDWIIENTESDGSNEAN